MKFVRLIAGIIIGYVVMALIVVGGIWIVSAAMGVENPGDVSVGYLAANLILSFLAAVAGGYAAAWIAGPLRLVATGILAALVLVLGLLMESGTGQPDWYPMVLALLGAAGVAIGGWLRHEPVTNPAIL